MEKTFLLHTHAVMALLLFLLFVGQFIFVNSLKENTETKKWFRLYLVGMFFWQAGDMIRYSLHPAMIGSGVYDISIALVTIPGFCLLEVAYLQFLYYFIGNPFDRERKFALYLSIVISISLFLFVLWNHFIIEGDLELANLLGPAYAIVINFFAMVMCFRKAVHFYRKNDKVAAEGMIYMTLINLAFNISTAVQIIYGFYSPIGYWTFFIVVWIANLAEIVVYINYALLPTSFQTKMIGFTSVIVMSVLMTATLVLYPLLPPTELEITLTQQDGLAKLIFLILGSLLVIVFLLPRILRFTLSDPLQKLLEGVQRVNSGDLTTEVPIVHFDEIGNITSNFNLMTQSLQQSKSELVHYTNTLEQKVKERTADLEQSLKDLKKTQAQLIQSEKMASLGELTAGIAHEIQNPLNFVNNFSEVSSELVDEMLEELEKGDHEEVKAISTDLKDNLEKITHHGKRAEGIVKGMLLHSRKTTGEKEAVDINKLINEYLWLSYHGFRAKDKAFNVTFKTELEKDLPSFQGVRQELGRVFLNIFNNGFQAIAEKQSKEGETYVAEFLVSTRNKDNSINIAIQDNGYGIPDNIKDKIFQPFFTTKPTGQGTGLGLSLSYDIVKAHGGELRVESKEGEGCVFIIELPVG